MQEIQFIQAWATLAIARVKTSRDERGASEVAAVVIITAIVAAAAILIAAAIMGKFKTKADTIPTE
ncbi:hypothetical protein DDE18_15680 [Nocardioides gansuensis]|uniref:Uncharacterized protein n=1 Tax=Nocardioides gansuensis TaxID=2138300 RepID=A0A2T8F8X5_9ACTN|nr:hypothetical protein [Nocardioides gansuensis]PVG82117.1 hypothetical protein DDE18_15680 [Nocardioides gansuensis]